jgi:alpha-methylacyl-CoA racemase
MGILSGLRIVEFDALGPVPLCAMLLADHGAEVIRIARADSPETEAEVAGEILHRSRPSIALDLKSEAGRDAALSLVDQADALMEGFRPGVMERLGLGPDLCLARNPRLVYGRMTGWGQDGPLAQRAGHDINFVALAGALGLLGSAGSPPPPPLNLVGDYAGGSMFLAFGLLAGILEATRSGRGQVVDVAMCDAVPVLLSLFHAFAQSGRWSGRRADNLLDGGAPFYRCYACRDGRHVAVGAIEPQFYARLMTGLDLPLPDHPQHDRSRWPATEAAIAERFLTRDRDDWARHFQAIDACVTPVLGLAEARLDPHLAARAVFSERDGRFEAAPAPRFGRNASRISPPLRITPEQALARWSR